MAQMQQGIFTMHQDHKEVAGEGNVPLAPSLKKFSGFCKGLSEMPSI